MGIVSSGALTSLRNHKLATAAGIAVVAGATAAAVTGWGISDSPDAHPGVEAADHSLSLLESGDHTGAWKEAYRATQLLERTPAEESPSAGKGAVALAGFVAAQATGHAFAGIALRHARSAFAHARAGEIDEARKDAAISWQTRFGSFIYGAHGPGEPRNYAVSELRDAGVPEPQLLRAQRTWNDTTSAWKQWQPLSGRVDRLLRSASHGDLPAYLDLAGRTFVQQPTLKEAYGWQDGGDVLVGELTDFAAIFERLGRPVATPPPDTARDDAHDLSSMAHRG